MSGGLDREKVKLWRERFRRRALFSGTVEEFCRGEGVSIATFYLWRKRLAGSSVQRRRGEQDAFRPVLVTPSLAALSVRLPGGVELEVPRENLATANSQQLEVVRVVVAELVRARHDEAASGDSTWPDGVVPC